MKFLCIGNITYDITMPVEKYPEENTKIRIKTMTGCGGGPASNAAYFLGKWGVHVHLLGMVGNDFYGDKVVQELKDASVDTTYVETNSTYTTPVAHVIVNIKKGTRTVLTYRESTQMQSVDLPFDPDIILMDGQEFEMSKKLIKNYEKAITILDAGRVEAGVLELSTLCKYVICSKEFAENITNEKVDISDYESLTRLYKKLKEKCKGIIIVTLEENGCLYELDGTIKVMPSIKVNAVDTTGAGDIFHGAFAYGLSKQYALEKNLTLSTIAGALSVQSVGSHNSVPTKEAVREYIYDIA